MSGELIRVFQKDPKLAAELAASPGESLGQIMARQYLDAQRIEAERRRRADAAAEAWRAHEDAQHRRAIEAARAPAPEFTQGQVRDLAHGVAPYLDEALARTLAPCAARLGELERASLNHSMALELGLGGIETRLDEIQAKPLLEDAGIWDQSTVYRPGQTVTCGGSAWVCKEANSNAKPGASACWRLMIKKGRDGKDKR